MIAFHDLGMEAIYEFEVKDMPVTVVVDSQGENVHATGPAIWKVFLEQGQQQKKVSLNSITAHT